MKYKIFRLSSKEFKFDKSFSSVKRMQNYLSRYNKYSTAKQHVWNDGKWERFAVVDNQVLPVSVLQNLLDSINNENDGE